MKRLLLIGFVALAPMSAHADWQTGSSLMGHCMARENSPQFGLCLGYLEGIGGAMALNRVNDFVSCVPLGVTSGQMREIVLRSLWNHPEERKMAATGLVARALEDAFPCRRSNS